MQATSIPSTLFVHLPKTGGTTLDAVITDSLVPTPIFRWDPVRLGRRAWRDVLAGHYLYVSGHIPAGALHLSLFQRKVTVLREPVAMLASWLSYTVRIDQNDNRLQSMRERNIPIELYREYFSPGYDMDRRLLEHDQLIETQSYYYSDPCTVAEALDVLDRFEHVLDFANLDGEMMRLIMAWGLRPRMTFERRRQYAYSPDTETAGRMLSNFDDRFYQSACSRVRPLEADTVVRYEQYIADYARMHGIAIDPYRTHDLALDHAIGSNWHDAEYGSNGEAFRWSTVDSPRLEMPISCPGLYSVHLYVYPHGIRGLEARILARSADDSVAMRRMDHERLCVFSGHWRLDGPDWLMVAFDHEPVPTDRTKDVRERGFILGRALIRRLGP